jgi:hypothetical protein
MFLLELIRIKRLCVAFLGTPLWVSVRMVSFLILVLGGGKNTTIALNVYASLSTGAW